MATVMTLGGVSLGENFPVYSKDFEYMRDGDQGASFLKVKINLSGFVEAEGTDAVMALYNTLKSKVNKNDTNFTYIQDGVTVESRQVWIGNYSEPADTEFAKCASGDYAIELYYFADLTNELAIPCSFNGYTFDKPPKWGRRFFKNKQQPHASYRDLATIGVISLSGHLFGDTHSNLMMKIEALQRAFVPPPGEESIGVLRYGDFSATCYASPSCQINPDVMKNFCYYDLELYYYIGDIIDFSYKFKSSRIHYNPVITEQPYCNTRTIDLMNRSGQTISYAMSCVSTSLERAKQIISEELFFAVESGGTELPGGDQEYDSDNNRVSVQLTKFYDIPVHSNLGP